jgi:serine/threonine protein kinase
MNGPAPELIGTADRGIRASLQPPLIPDHELLRRIGSGSYGEVWLARNVLGEFRAVKVVYRDRFEHERPYEREFYGIRKFEPISRLHDSQVDILHVGRNDEAGCFYYVMELADDANAELNARPHPVPLPRGEGETSSARRHLGAHRIRESGPISVPSPEGEGQGEGGPTSHSQLSPQDPLNYIPHTLKLDLHRRIRLPVDECLTIGLALTTAVQHLHEHGLVHRDIKPSNIIFVGGVPKLADIGLVASMDQTMSFVGTSGFLPPEGPGTPQGDLYSLGKVLYEIIMGRDRTDFPKLPPNLAELDDPPRLLELNAVILKACHHDPRRRYQSAQEMASDLALLQRGQSVKRKRASELRWAAGKKFARVTASAALMLVAAYLLFQVISQRRLPKIDSPSAGTPFMQGTTNMQAWRLYQEGLYSSRKRTPDGMQSGIDRFQNAIRLDPRFALAHAGLFEMYIAQANNLDEPPLHFDAKLRATAQALKELDDNLAETHAAQAWVKTQEWKWAEAEREYQKAIQIDPKNVFAHAHYGFWLGQWGRAKESRRELLRADEIDPTFPVTKKNLGHPYYVERDFTNALVHYRKSLELERAYPLGHYWVGRACQAAGDLLRAIEEFEWWEILVSRNPARVKRDYQSLRQAYGESGGRGYWLRWLELENASSNPNTYHLAEIHAHLGEFDAAFEWLEKAYAERNQMENLIFDECWDPLRDDPRFKALLKRVGLAN